MCGSCDQRVTARIRDILAEVSEVVRGLACRDDYRLIFGIYGHRLALIESPSPTGESIPRMLSQGRPLLANAKHVGEIPFARHRTERCQGDRNGRPQTVVPLWGTEGSNPAANLISSIGRR
jgi:hypothetical protein